MANEKTIDEILDDLAKFYERKQSPAQRLFYVQTMKQYDEDLLCRAVMSLKKTEKPNAFPTLATINKYYVDERDAAWQRQKSSEPRRENLAGMPPRSERHQAFLKLFSGIGRMPKREWLKLGVDSGVFTETDVQRLRETWRQMGVDEDKWQKSDLL